MTTPETYWPELAREQRATIATLTHTLKGMNEVMTQLTDALKIAADAIVAAGLQKKAELDQANAALTQANADKASLADQVSNLQSQIQTLNSQSPEDPQAMGAVIDELNAATSQLNAPAQ